MSAKEAARDVYHDIRAWKWPDTLLNHIGKMVGGMAEYTGDSPSAPAMFSMPSAALVNRFKFRIAASGS